MARQRIRTKVFMGGGFDAGLATKFGQLAQANGVSIREALRRIMVQAILTGRIPGIESLDLEQREHEKWGVATPTFDGEDSTKKTPGGKTAPAPPVE